MNFIKGTKITVKQYLGMKFLRNNKIKIIMIDSFSNYSNYLYF
jgi:hypothetical protein